MAAGAAGARAVSAAPACALLAAPHARVCGVELVSCLEAVPLCYVLVTTGLRQPVVFMTKRDCVRYYYRLQHTAISTHLVKSEGLG